MPLLEIRNLMVSFDTAAGAFAAVDGFDLDVEPDEVVAIVGESGSGKSVAMLAVMGLLPDAARVTADRLAFAGHDLLDLAPRERRRLVGKDMAMVFQEPAASLNPCFTVGFQIGEALRTHLGMDRKARRQRSIELLREVGIPEPERRLAAFPHQLSGGMSQRVMIAMALACRPKLLIADEPTTALDVTIQAQILDLFARLRREGAGTGLIFITHNLAVVAEIADRVAVMYAGEIVELAPTASIFEWPSHPYTMALIAALPTVSGPRRVLSSLPGEPFVPSGAIIGCRFAPRCPRAAEICRTTPPPRVAVGAGHDALCHFARATEARVTA